MSFTRTPWNRRIGHVDGAAAPSRSTTRDRTAGRGPQTSPGSRGGLGAALALTALGAACGGAPSELELEETEEIEQAVGGVVLSAGFETPLTSSFLYQPVTGATLYQAAGVQGAQYQTSGWVPAPEGSQQAFLQSGGSIERTVALSGTTQTLSFRARRTTQLGGSLTAPLQVYMGPTLVASVVPSSSGFQSFTVYTSGSGHRNLRFVNPAGAAKTLIDQVVLRNSSGGTILAEGYESPVASGSFIYQPVSSDWLYTGSGVQRSAYVNGGWLVAPVGQQFGFLQSGASMRRVVSFPAGTYRLSMRLARSPQLGGSMTTPLQVYVDSTLVGSVATANTSFTAVTLPPFTVGAGRRVVSIVNPAGAALTFIDEVAIQQ